MNRRLVSGLSMLLVVGAGTMWGDAASACTCAEPRGALETAESTPQVFIGRVATIERETRPLFSKGQSCTTVNYVDGKVLETGSKPCPEAAIEIHVVTFDVLESLKGVASDRVTLRTKAQLSACGVAFITGKEYLVYAFDGEEAQPWTSACLPTAPMNRRARRESRQLREHFAEQ